MPQNTYTLIEKITVGAAGASSVTFTSIPQTYTDLVIKWSGRDNQSGSTANDCAINFNGSATSFTGRRLYGNGTSALSDTVAPYAGSDTAAAATTSTFSNNEIYIPNYTGSTNKSFSLDSVTERNGTEAYQLLYAGLWSNTAAITSISIVAPVSYPFQQYSTFYLYGVAKEGVTPGTSSAPYATGGDRIVFDGTYWYHAFTSSGTFTPRKDINCDVLVVAGGGSGGDSGGGGAGGLLAYTSQSLTVQNYTVTVGGGGAAAGNDAAGNLGNDSQFGSLTASKGGGRGRGYALTTTGDGGSGGGGSGNHANSQAGGTATSGQGNNGGAGTATFIGGGGGGAGAVGGSGSGTSATGGNGSSTYSSWGLATGAGENVSGTYYFAGGGGGGGSQTAGTNITAGGLGGGGDGNATTASGAKNAMANTGGGGGGTDGGSGESSGAGGSGIVIVRYAA